MFFIKIGEFLKSIEVEFIIIKMISDFLLNFKTE